MSRFYDWQSSNRGMPNDVSAIGVLHKAYRAGLRVPQDVSVIGFDDTLHA